MHPISHILSTMLVGCAPVFCLGESILGFSLEYFIYYSLLRIIEQDRCLWKHQRAACSTSEGSVHVFVCKWLVVPSEGM